MRNHLAKRNLLGVAVTGYSVNALANTAAVTSALATVATGDWSQMIFGISANVLFACFCGAVVALRFLTKMSRWGMFLSVVIATITAGYFAPVIADILEIKRMSAVGFGTGLAAYYLLSIGFARGETWISKRMGGE
jgi:hypothetical protein